MTWRTSKSPTGSAFRIWKQCGSRMIRSAAAEPFSYPNKHWLQSRRRAAYEMLPGIGFHASCFFFRLESIPAWGCMRLYPAANSHGKHGPPTPHGRSRCVNMYLYLDLSACLILSILRYVFRAANNIKEHRSRLPVKVLSL
jgi:hypothetical protein